MKNGEKNVLGINILWPEQPRFLHEYYGQFYSIVGEKNISFQYHLFHFLLFKYHLELCKQSKEKCKQNHLRCES